MHNFPKKKWREKITKDERTHDQILKPCENLDNKSLKADREHKIRSSHQKSSHIARKYPMCNQIPKEIVTSNFVEVRERRLMIDEKINQ